MPEAFYPFVEADDASLSTEEEVVRFPARVAVYDDEAAAPRVVVIEPQGIRGYLEELTATVTKLAREQGGGIPFMVIREIVENLIHAYFAEPAISILDGGDTIRFADQGPGIANKELAMEYGTTSATNEMKRYIRGVGSGLPYAHQWLSDKGGRLTIEDNISRGTIVTITLVSSTQTAGETNALPAESLPSEPMPYQQQPQVPQASLGAPWIAYGTPPQPWQQGAYPYNPTYPTMQAYQPMPVVGGVAQAMPAATQPPAGSMAPQPTSVSERGMMALGYLATHESVGPTELVATFGHSQSTWTRELKSLEDAGMVAKRGQKRFLTPAGRAYLMR